jgi:hypothetical protein
VKGKEEGGKKRKKKWRKRKRRRRRRSSSQALVDHAYKPSYLGGSQFEARSSKSFSLLDLICKITTAGWTGGMAQAVELLLCEHKALSSNPSPI